MLDPIIQFFERLVTQFSWGRLLLLISTLFIGIGVLAWYESYTGRFRLGRIEHSTALLDKLTELGPKVKAASDDGLTKIHNALVADLKEYVSDRGTPFSINRSLLKALAALFPWILLGAAVQLGSNTGGGGAAFAGMSVAAVPCITIAVFLPDYERSWINYLGYPFGSMLSMVALVTIWQSRKKRNA